MDGLQEYGPLSYAVLNWVQQISKVCKNLADLQRYKILRSSLYMDYTDFMEMWFNVTHLCYSKKTNSVYSGDGEPLHPIAQLVLHLSTLYTAQCTYVANIVHMYEWHINHAEFNEHASHPCLGPQELWVQGSGSKHLGRLQNKWTKILILEMTICGA